MTVTTDAPAMSPSIESRPISRFRPALSLVLAAALGACAPTLQEKGFEGVRSLSPSPLQGQIRWIRTDRDAKEAEEEIAALLEAPLTVEGAVKIALLGNRGLQASYNELGLSAVALVRTVTPPNPGFTYGRTERGGLVEIERKLTLDLFGLLTLPFAASIEERRWEQAKLRTAEQILRVAADTRRAYYRAVAAQQMLGYVGQVRMSAQSAADLGRRLGQAGTFSKLSQAREQVFYADVAAQYARARQASIAERERLVRTLGLWGSSLAFTLPDRLPEVPKEIQERADLEAATVERRLDIRKARLEVEGLARSYGLTQATRFVNVLEGSYLSSTSTGEPKKTGYEIELSVPIFDLGTTRVAEAESVYLQAVNRLAELAVNARSEVREQYEIYRINHELAVHYLAAVVPMRKTISEENLLRYNGMLISVFELLADAREQIAAVVAAIEAQRDFWISDADLEAVLAGGARGAAEAGSRRRLAVGDAKPGH
jgi:outer membrane protein TolC